MKRRIAGDWPLLLSAQWVSVLGSQVTAVALPVIAIVQLDASIVQASQLLLAEFLPAALLGPLAGVVVDRNRLRPLLIGCDLARGAALLVVPLSIHNGFGSIWLLYGIGALIGIFSAVFDAAAETALPALMPADRLAHANSRRSGALSIARIAGPALGGLLVSIVSAADALVADACTFVASALLLAGIRAARVRASTAQPLGAPGSVTTQLREGFRTVLRNVVLFRGILGMATLNLGGGGIGALYYLFAYRTLHLDAADVGLTMSLLSVGALAGAAAANPLTRWLGTAQACLLAAAVAAGALFLIPLAALSWPLALLMAYQIAFGAAATTWSIIMATLRQRRTPADRLGRVSAVTSAVVTATLPIGTLLAAVLASTIGLTGALVVLAAVAALTPLWYSTPAFRRAADDDVEPTSGDEEQIAGQGNQREGSQPERKDAEEGQMQQYARTDGE